MSQDNPQPAGYPQTDVAERNAIKTLQSLFDSKYVKDSIAHNSSIPNQDGFIELVDNDKKIYGKITVQVKHIQEGVQQFSCPIELYAYSMKLSEPFILICVDSILKKAFWKQLTPKMPEYKSNQMSFTIYFLEPENLISNDGLYLQKWNQIVYDYRLRVNDYPELKEQYDKVNMSSISEEAKYNLATYIERINTLLDNNFQVIKEYKFPGVLKLGIGIYEASSEKYSYELCKILHGSKQPYIYLGEKKEFNNVSFKSNIVNIRWIRHSGQFDPIKEANVYVHNLVNDFVNHKRFNNYSILMCSSILFHFIDNYADCFNLVPSQIRYDLEQIRCGFYGRLMKHCTSGGGGYYEKVDGFPLYRLETLNDYFKNRDQNKNVTPFKTNSNINPSPFFIKAKWESPDFNYFADCLNYLTAKRVFEIKRDEKFINIYDLYLHDDEAMYVKQLLELSIIEYDCFVRENKLFFNESPYLNHSTTILFVYTKIKKSTAIDLFQIDEYHFDNFNGKLPKIYVKVDEKTREMYDKYCSQNTSIVIDGINFGDYNSAQWGCDICPFTETPILDLLYYMLINDLEKNYGIKIHFFNTVHKFYPKLLTHVRQTISK